MADILSISRYQPRDIAIDRIITLGDNAWALQGVPLDVLAPMMLFDTDNRRIDAKTALSRIARVILDLVHGIESYQRSGLQTAGNTDIYETCSE